MQPDAELHPLRAQLEGKAYRGHEGLREMLADFDQDWEYVRMDARGVPGRGRRGRRAGPPPRPRAGQRRRARRADGICLDPPRRQGGARKDVLRAGGRAPGCGPRVAPPPKPGSRPDGAGRLLRRGDRRHRRCTRRGRAAQSLLQRPGAGRPPGRAGRALPVAVRAVRGRGAGGRVRGRGDGPLRLRGRLRGRGRGADLGADPGPAIPRPAARGGALRRALDRDPGHRARGARQRGADGTGRLRLSGGDRQPAPGALPDRLRGGLDAPAGGRRGRGGPRGTPTCSEPGSDVVEGHR